MTNQVQKIDELVRDVTKVDSMPKSEVRRRIVEILSTAKREERERIIEIIKDTNDKAAGVKVMVDGKDILQSVRDLYMVKVIASILQEEPNGKEKL